IARANAIESLGGDNTELKIKKLDLNSSRERARARAEAMLAGEQGFEVKEKADSIDANENTDNLEVKEKTDNKVNS
ncbi:MAG TPA: hypothetical protein PLA01_06485, partial [Acetivibrio sp.]|nr:hypothetical protein [Acetivibrio sp.]